MTSAIDLDLTGKVAFVSGGASGIGRSIARSLMAQGAKVLVSDIEGNTLSDFLASHPSAKGIEADAASWPDTQKVFSEIRSTLGRLDILINNAGISGPTATAEEIRLDEWDRTLAVNINGAFYCTKLAVPMIRKSGGGSIINIASNAAFFGVPLRSPYAAAKWAMVGLTKTWAMELGTDGIRVNALCPGSVSGPRIDAVIQKDAELREMKPEMIRDIYQRQNSMHLLMEPEDVAAMAVFLCSKAGSKISGQAIGVDGHTEGFGSTFR